jgi:hypothetical protein
VKGGRWEKGPGGEGRLGRALLALFLLAAPALAQPRPAPTPAPAAPQLQVTLPAQPPTVGDRVEVVLNLQVPAGEQLAGEPRFPAWRQSWGEAEIVEATPPQEIGAGRWRQTVLVTAFRPGQVALPPVEVALPYRDRTVQAATPAGLALTVRSVLPAPKEGEKPPAPQPPAPPRRLPAGEMFLWVAAGLAAACFLLGLLLFRKRKAVEGEAPARTPLPAFEELLGELNVLARDPALPAVQSHVRISQALRRYFGRSLSFPAMESTTTEIQRRLLGRRISSTLVRRTVELLRACDMVKFARQEVGPERVQERIETARDLAREYERQIHPPAANPADAAERREAVG